MSRTRSPPRPHNQERLIDSQPTMQGSMCATLPTAHPYPATEPRILVLGMFNKLEKKLECFYFLEPKIEQEERISWWMVIGQY